MTVFVPNKCKAHSLTGRITAELVEAAFKAVKRNRGAAGVDRVSIKMFESNLGMKRVRPLLLMGLISCLSINTRCIRATI